MCKITSRLILGCGVQWVISHCGLGRIHLIFNWAPAKCYLFSINHQQFSFVYVGLQFYWNFLGIYWTTFTCQYWWGRFKGILIKILVWTSLISFFLKLVFLQLIFPLVCPFINTESANMKFWILIFLKSLLLLEKSKMIVFC